ncbi:MAG: hypothetical protein ACREUO_12935 [Burkholderiales bacterium]
MSEHAAPSKQPARDLLQELAHEIYVELCGRVYSATGAEKPQPRAVAQLAFKLAETFHAASLEFNPVAKAAREAKDKASVNLANVHIDFANLGKPK